jgi:hypothetical protein
MSCNLTLTVIETNNRAFGVAKKPGLFNRFRIGTRFVLVSSRTELGGALKEK